MALIKTKTLMPISGLKKSGVVYKIHITNVKKL